jgi:hypothetical protein
MVAKPGRASQVFCTWASALWSSTPEREALRRGAGGAVARGPAATFANALARNSSFAELCST